VLFNPVTTLAAKHTTHLVQVLGGYGITRD